MAERQQGARLNDGPTIEEAGIDGIFGGLGLPGVLPRLESIAKPLSPTGLLVESGFRSGGPAGARGSTK